MNRKGFLGRLLGLAVLPKIIKEESDCVSIDEVKDYLTLEDFKGIDHPFNFRELVPTEKQDYLPFVTYRPK